MCTNSIQGVPWSRQNFWVVLNFGNMLSENVALDGVTTDMGVVGIFAQ